MNYIVVYCVLDKSFELLRRQQLSIMQQFGASAFYTVVHWHKQGEVDSEYILHISIVLVICVPKIIKYDGNLTKLWQKQVGSFFWYTLYLRHNYWALKSKAGNFHLLLSAICKNNKTPNNHCLKI